MYPEEAGFKVGGTSAEAAQSTPAASLRIEVMDRLRAHERATADEIAADLGYSVLAIRPRFSELRALGAIGDSGLRGINLSGKRAIIWEVL